MDDTTWYDVGALVLVHIDQDLINEQEKYLEELLQICKDKGIDVYNILPYNLPDNPSDNPSDIFKNYSYAGVFEYPSGTLDGDAIRKQFSACQQKLIEKGISGGEGASRVLVYGNNLGYIDDLINGTTQDSWVGMHYDLDENEGSGIDPLGELDNYEAVGFSYLDEGIPRDKTTFVVLERLDHALL